jgi:hypothetical protein
MRKPLFFLLSVALSLSLSQDSFAYKPYYELDFDKVEEAQQQLKKLVQDNTNDTSLQNIVKHFDEVCQNGKRGPSPLETMDPVMDSAQVYKQTWQRCKPVGVHPNFYRNGKLKFVEEMKDEIKTKCEGTQYDSNNILQAIEKEISKTENMIASQKEEDKKNIKLYQAYLKRYGIWHVQKFENYLFNALFEVEGYQDNRNPLGVRVSIFKTLVDAGFIKNVSTNFSDLVTTLKLQDPTETVKQYLIDHPDTTELGLGDGHALSSSTTDALKIPQEADCAMRPFGLGEINTDALRIDMRWGANPDVVGNMHKIWQGIGNKKFSKIADMSWRASLSEDNTLKSIFDALNSGGVFEVWDQSYTSQESSQSDIESSQSDIDRVMKFGYKSWKIIPETNILQFFKG